MSLAHSPVVVTKGLVLYLDAANVKSYPGTGLQWYDISGNNNTSTISSGEFVASGYLRNLNNVSNFFSVNVPDSDSINSALSVTTGGWTIEELIYTNSVTYPEADAGAVASDSGYQTGATGFDWNHGIGNNAFQFGMASKSTGAYQDLIDIVVPSPYNSLNVWKLRSMVWNRSLNTVSLYINGAYIGGGNTTNTAGKPIYDGNGISFGSLYGWKHYGRRSVIRIYNRVLTSAEIIQNFSALRGRYGI